MCFGPSWPLLALRSPAERAPHGASRNRSHVLRQGSGEPDAGDAYWFKFLLLGRRAQGCCCPNRPMAPNKLFKAVIPRQLEWRHAKVLAQNLFCADLEVALQADSAALRPCLPCGGAIPRA